MPTDPRTTLEQAEAQRIYRAQLADMPLDVIIAYLRERGAWPGPAELPPAPPIPCDICGEPLDNLQGEYLVRRQGRVVRACHRCYPTRPGDDVLVAIARGL